LTSLRPIAPEPRVQAEEYPISNEFKADFDEFIENGKMQLREDTLPVWFNKKLLKPADFEKYLSGALVEVDFCLKHFFLRPQDGERGSNTYTGAMQQVKILRLPPPPTPSPFSSRSAQGPIRINQVSPKKKQARTISAHPTVGEGSQTSLPADHTEQGFEESLSSSSLGKRKEDANVQDNEGGDEIDTHEDEEEVMEELRNNKRTRRR
jgi:hypothetical protein